MPNDRKKIEAQLLAANIDMAKYLLPHLGEVNAAVDEDAGKFIARVEAAREHMLNPSDHYTQATNIIDVIKNVHGYFTREVERLEGLIKLGEKTE